MESISYNLQKNRTDIALTVAIPLYNSSKIFWLCLEGLCNQKTSYPWELIICEDPSKTFCGKEYVEPYMDRLKAAGCVRYEYIQLNGWIPLGEKWKVIGDAARGVNFMLTAADNYSPSDRIELSCRRLVGDVRWFDCRESLFYNVLSKEQAHFRVLGDMWTGVWMCTKSELVRSLQGKGPRVGIDGWMQGQFNLTTNQKATVEFTNGKKVCTRVNKKDLGFHTDGYNNISFGRKRKYVNGTYGGVGVMSKFSPPMYSIQDILNIECLHRIADMGDPAARFQIFD